MLMSSLGLSIGYRTFMCNVGFDRNRLARQCAQKWAESREKLGYPLGVWEESPCPETTPQASTQVRSLPHLIID